MNKDKEKDIDQQSNPSFTKEDLLGKQEQSEPAEQQEQEEQESEKTGREASEGEEDQDIC